MNKTHSILVFVSCLLFISVTSYISYFYVPSKIERSIVQKFESLGFEAFAFESIKTEDGHTIFSNISLDKESFSTIEEIDIEFSALKFMIFSNYAHNMVVRGLNLTGELSNDFEVSFSGWENGSSLIDAFHAIPASLITIEDGTLNVLSEDLGGIRVTYEVQVHPFKKDGPSIKGRLSSTQKNISFQSKLYGSLSKDGHIELQAETDQFSMILNDVILKRGHGGVKFLRDEKTGLFSFIADITAASVQWEDFPLKDTQITWNKSTEQNNIRASGKVFGPEDIAWSSQIDFTEGVARTEITVIPIDIPSLNAFLKRNNTLKNDVNFPGFLLVSKNPKISVTTSSYQNALLDGRFKLLLSDPAIEVEGRFGTDAEDNKITGDFSVAQYRLEPTFQNQKEKLNTYFDISSSGQFNLHPFSNNPDIDEIPELTWSADVNLEDSQLDYGALKLSDMQHTFKYNSESSKKVQNQLDFKLPLKSKAPQKGKVRINILNPEKPFFENIQYNIYGGKIKTANPLFKNGALNIKNKLVVSDINLEQLFKDADFADIVISGHLGGLIPFNAEGGRIDVDDAILQSQDSGIIKLPKYMIDALFPGNTRKMYVIRESLKNYYYEYFEIRLDGDLAGRVMMTLNARGYNPDFRNQESVDLSLQIETQISLLFENLLK